MQTSKERLTNPEKDQDRVRDTVDHFERFGYIMFPQQTAIYHNIGKQLDRNQTVLEAGSGNGIGTAIIEHLSNCLITGTDKLETNVKFARCLYPWIPFEVWDINEPWRSNPRDVVVCIETFEHIADPEKAMANLLSAATKQVIISTPNGEGKYRPPHNPYHVCEYTSDELYHFLFPLLGPYTSITWVHYKTWEPLPSKESLPEIITMVINK